MTIEEQEKIVSKYVVSGIPMSCVKAMCDELNVNEKRLMEYMNGQTMGMIGNEGVIYEWDIMRFIKGLPNID